MGDASDSGERGKTRVERMIEKTHISVRTAVIIVLVAVIPLTLFLNSLSSRQQATDTKIESNSTQLNVKLDENYKQVAERMETNSKQVADRMESNSKEFASKMDSLIAVMGERKIRRDEQVTAVEKKLEDHEVRIRIIEKTH